VGGDEARSVTGGDDSTPMLCVLDGIEGGGVRLVKWAIGREGWISYLKRGYDYDPHLAGWQERRRYLVRVRLARDGERGDRRVVARGTGAVAGPGRCCAGWRRTGC
jgi:hypothetical protein